MRTVLQFSGGKDSLACLYLLKDRWQDLTVIWSNAGAQFDEVISLMERIRAEVPHFIEVRSDVLADIAERGLPVDVLPAKATQFGHMVTRTDLPVLRTWIECCRDNVWFPLQRKCEELGATTIIRGQRDDEHYRSPIRDGMIINGVRYELPIQDWSEAQVDDYLASIHVELPDYYRYSAKSVDCWNCTAWLGIKGGVLAHMKAHHPDKHRHVMDNLKLIHAAIREDVDALERALANG